VKARFGLDQNLAAALSYLLGVFTAAAFLAIEKDNAYVRFHARQSLITFVAVVVVGVVAVAVPFVGGLLVRLFTVGVSLLWLFLMYKALIGERYKLPYIGDMADRMNG